MHEKLSHRSGLVAKAKRLWPDRTLFERENGKGDTQQPGYHRDPKQPLPFAGLASQKNHMSIYVMCVYGDPGHEAWFRAAWASRQGGGRSPTTRRGNSQPYRTQSDANRRERAGFAGDDLCQRV